MSEIQQRRWDRESEDNCEDDRDAACEESSHERSEQQCCEERRIYQAILHLHPGRLRKEFQVVAVGVTEVQGLTWYPIVEDGALRGNAAFTESASRRF